MKKSFNQRISEAEKRADDFQWAKDIIDLLIPSYSGRSIHLEDQKEAVSNYRLYNNVLDQEEFERVCNPLGIDVGQFQERVMPYNKTPNKINVLLGEQLKRGEGFKPLLTNQRALAQKDTERKEKYRDLINIEIEKTLAEAEMEMQGLPEEEIAKVVEEMRAAFTPHDLESGTFLSSLEILGNDILNFARYDQSIREKSNDGFKHALLSGVEMVYIGVEDGKPVIRLVNPIHAFYQKSPEVKMIQYGDYAGERIPVTISRILDLYGEELSDKDIEKLETRIVGRKTSMSKSPRYDVAGTDVNRELRSGLYDYNINDDIGSYGNDFNRRAKYFNEKVWVTHLEWISQRKVGFLTYINSYGEEVTELVDDSYSPPEDARLLKETNEFGKTKKRWVWFEGDQEMSITYSWIPRVWEGIKIAEDIYIRMREKPNQPLVLENHASRVKLGYHGLVFSAMNAKPISVMSRMKPFQFLYFVAMHQLIELLSRNFGKLINFDVAQLAEELEDEESGRTALEMTLFYMRKGFLFYNSYNNAEGGAPPANRGAATGHVDVTTTQDMINLANLCDWLDLQIGEAAGISKQREGAFTPSSNVTDNQQAITQSSHITEIHFNAHNELWRSVMESYVSTFQRWAKNYLAKNRNKSEHRLSYVLPDNSKAVLSITADMFEDVDYGVYMANAGFEQLYIDKMEQLMLPIIQNQLAGFEEISYILKSRAEGTSAEEIHQMIKEFESRRKNQEAQLQQQQGEQAKEIEKMRIQAQKEAHENEKELIILKESERRKTELDKAALQAFGFFENKDVDNDGTPDILELLRDGREAKIEASKLQLEKQKLDQEKNLKNRELDIKEEEIQAKKSEKSK